jgi:hypothetical protein
LTNTYRKARTSLKQIVRSRLKINVVKSFFARTKLEYLGYNISRDGIWPSQKKVKAIIKI